jgi:AcrR family transcriptional regulator
MAETNTDAAAGIPPSGAAGGEQDPLEGLGERALRTRQKILETSKRLFLERGYVGTSVNSITEACGISRAGFYTYFRDKREIFNVLGEETYRELLNVVGELERLPEPLTLTAAEGWVRRYFDFLDVHGAFTLSSQSAPSDDDVRQASNRMYMRVAWLIGTYLRRQQSVPTQAPEALGLTVQAMIDRTWFMIHGQSLPVDEKDAIRAIAELLVAA